MQYTGADLGATTGVAFSSRGLQALCKRIEDDGG
jgi:hypothetical protein